jgi:hypothetical protein
MSKLKQILNRLFRPGRMPEETKEQLQSEGLLFFKEKVWITVVFRNFKAPGRRYSYRRSSTYGSFALTETRVVGLSLLSTIINVAYNSPEFQSIQFEAKSDKYLSAKFDASIFNPSQSGEIEFRFHLPELDQAIEIIKSRMSK